MNRFEKVIQRTDWTTSSRHHLKINRSKNVVGVSTLFKAIKTMRKERNKSKVKRFIKHFGNQMIGNLMT